MTDKKPDQAQVIISSPLKIEVMQSLLKNIELLLRINPFHEIKFWNMNGQTLQLELRNLQNQQIIKQEICLARQQDSVLLHYAEGIKAHTLFKLRPANMGTELIIREDYSRYSEAERQQRIHEVDQTLLPWAHALNRFFKAYKRWSWLPGWKSLQIFWFSMSPSQRLVSRIVIWATLIEFIIFLLIWVDYH